MLVPYVPAAGGRPDAAHVSSSTKMLSSTVVGPDGLLGRRGMRVPERHG
jgi:hypothetical protein